MTLLGHMGYDIEKIRREKLISSYAATYLKLTKNGKELRACCPFHNEKSASFTIFPGKNGSEKYYCFGCGSSGDIVDFVMRYHGVDWAGAMDILGGVKEAPNAQRSAEPAPEAQDTYAGWTVLKPPTGAPPIIAGKRTPKLFNPKRQNDDGSTRQTSYEPSMVFPYRNGRGELIGYVLRVEIERGKKITPLILWMKGPNGEKGWSHGAFPKPRPLYGLDLLTAHPTWSAWIVEGEKSADALNRIFKATGDQAIALSWQGGGKGVTYANWGLLAGRRLVFWGDADQPGHDAIMGCKSERSNGPHWVPGAAQLVHEAGAQSVKVISWDKTKPAGWDAADAEKDGWSTRDIVEWAQPRVSIWTPATVALPQESPEAEEEPPIPSEADYGAADAVKHLQQEQPEPEHAGQDEVPSNVVSMRGEEFQPNNWRNNILYGENMKMKVKSSWNYSLFTEYHERLEGVFRFNELTKQVVICRQPPWHTEGSFKERSAIDSDAINLAAFLETFQFTPKKGDAADAIHVVAERNSFNPLADYFNSIKWDGIKRVDMWLTYYMGVPDAEINRMFGRKFLISAVARALRHGSKVDTMLILEGRQGLRKSTALRALATFPFGCLYTDDIADIGSKDSQMQLQGVLLLEMAELDKMGKAEVTTVKAFMSRQEDRFRPPFARTMQSFPRQCVFAGTVNPGGEGYFRDSTGGRRFWPVMVTAIDLESLEHDREQLWAEAVAMFRAGEIWWLTPEEEDLAKSIQADRYQDDPWGDRIDDFIDQKKIVSITEIMWECLHIPIDRQDQRTVSRIANHLQHVGWRREKRYHGLFKGTKNVYVPPDVV